MAMDKSSSSRCEMCIFHYDAYHKSCSLIPSNKVLSMLLVMILIEDLQMNIRTAPGANCSPASSRWLMNFGEHNCTDTAWSRVDPRNKELAALDKIDKNK